MGKILWETKNIKRSISSLEEMLKSNEIILPIFQRKLVWKLKQKQNFLDSMEMKWPTGSLILFSEEGNENQKLLLDGRQRLTTTLDIKNNFIQFITIDKLKRIFNDSNECQLKELTIQEPIVFKKIHKAILDANKNLIEKVEKEKGTWGWSSYQEYLKTEIRKIPDKHLEKIENTNKLERNISGSLEGYEIKYLSKSTDMYFSVIEYIGKMDEATKIFEYMNTGGTKLSKLEINSASWNNIKIKVEDENIKRLIKQRYEPTKYDISWDNVNSDSFTPFEVIYGTVFRALEISSEDKKGFLHYEWQWNKNDNDFLFKNLDKFLTLFYGIMTEGDGISKSNYQEAVGKLMDKFFNSPNFIEIFTNSFAESIVALNKEMEVLESRGNRKKSNKKANEVSYVGVTNKKFSFNLLISLLTQHMIQNYKISYEKETMVKNENVRVTIDRNMLWWLIKETISSTYKAGSNTVALNTIKETTYLKNINFDDVKVKIREIFEEELELLESKKTTDFNPTAKLMTNIIYNKTSTNDYLKQELEYDHVIPKSLINGSGINILSSFANCQLLTSKENLEKTDSIDIKWIMKDTLYEKCKSAEIKEEYISAFKDFEGSKNTSYAKHFLEKRLNMILYVLFDQ